MDDFEAICALIPEALDNPAVVQPEKRGFRGRVPGAGLALSGGGFRAMLFHIGALRRLHEIGALRHMSRISSVSGGSITAAQLAIRWDAIHADGAGTEEFVRLVQQPLFDFAGSRIDATSGLTGIVTPRTSIADKAASRYDEFFDGARLQDLPDDPRFVFCATNMGSGALVRFAKTYTADYRIGKRDGLDLPLGSVVAASAAFPPFLSPMVIELEADKGLTEQFPPRPGEQPPALKDRKPYTHRLELSDGGVYDNLGLQPVEQFNTLLVSDGGGAFEYEDSVASNWLGHMIRSWKVTDNQVRSLRRDRLVAEFTAKQRNGAFWGIRTTYTDYEKRAIAVDPGWATAMQGISTRLWPMAEDQRKQLINWSYCLADAAVRSYIDETIPAPSLPYPEQPLDEPPPEPKKKWWQRLPGPRPSLMASSGDPVRA